MEFNKEYFSSPYYFYIKEGKEDISVYFSVSNTLTEARKKDEVVKFNKKDKKEVEKTISKIQKEKKLKTNSDVKKTLNKKKDELDELVDYDGSILSSKIPIHNPYLSPKSTMDQEVVATRQTNNPITRGYMRVYWGEGEEKTDEVINETDFSDAFGYEETKDKNGPETFKTYVKELGLDKEEAAKRTRQQGKEPDPKKHKQKLERVPKKIKKQKGFIDRMTISEKENLEEEKKAMMKKMVEDIILTKKSGDKEMNKKSGLSKVLMKNLENIKKLADKEGIEINDLVKILKK